MWIGEMGDRPTMCHVPLTGQRGRDANDDPERDRGGEHAHQPPVPVGPCAHEDTAHAQANMPPRGSTVAHTPGEHLGHAVDQVAFLFLRQVFVGECSARLPQPVTVAAVCGAGERTDYPLRPRRAGSPAPSLARTAPRRAVGSSLSHTGPWHRHARCLHVGLVGRPRRDVVASVGRRPRCSHEQRHEAVARHGASGLRLLLDHLPGQLRFVTGRAIEARTKTGSADGLHRVGGGVTDVIANGELARGLTAGASTRVLGCLRSSFRCLGHRRV
jgi:hypothetical protein